MKPSPSAVRNAINITTRRFSLKQAPPLLSFSGNASESNPPWADTAKRNEPRIIDLDLILYDGFKSESYELTLPHPRILERAFVMAPLLELYPSGRAPGLFFGPHLRDIGMDGVRKTEKEIIIPIY